MKHEKTLKKGTVLLCSFAVLLCYVAIFIPFLPNSQGLLGHDYGLKMPQLLDGYFWFKKNGLFSVYWFSPSFCGGVPVFAHPINHFYSVVQFLTFWVGPLPSVGLSFLLFSLLGFWGFYLLMRRTAYSSRPVAFLCATLFLFNGFYWSKFLIGALDYHGFMLIPWTVFFLAPHGEGRSWCGSVQHTAVAGLVIAYMVYSGLQTLMPAMLLAVLLTGCILGIFSPQRFFARIFVVRLAVACLVSLGLCAAKLSAIFHFVGNFPRSYYPLPQFESMADIFRVMVGALWGAPMDALAGKTMGNAQFVLGRHEFEFGVGPVPFIVLFGAAAVFLFRRLERCGGGFTGLPRPFLMAVTCILGLIPVALNFYTPGWNAFLKQVPIIGSSTQCVRWFSVYIPVLVLLSGVLLERMVPSSRLRLVLAMAGVAATVFFNMTMDRNYYYLQQSYSGLRVQQVFLAVKEGVIDPHVTHISVPVDDCGRPGTPIYRNNAFLYNHSQMLCYDSMFGYGLEMLPFGNLHAGPVMDAVDGVLNIKNPVCYVFPDANGCRPGDHFTIDQEAAVLAFTHYRPFPFVMPLVQKVANGVTVCCLLVCIVLLAVGGGMQTWRKLRGIAS